MADKIAKIGKNLVKSVTTGQEVALETFWQDKPCVITFLRRFGWQYCRLSARELSSLKPQLDAHNVRMVGIGLEELGVEQFVQGKFFDGELYIDSKKQCYTDLEMPRLGFFAIIGKLFSRIARSRYKAAAALGGDMKGDGYQNGGTIIVDTGGKLLHKYIQENPADHMEPGAVLKALGITQEPPASAE